MAKAKAYFIDLGNGIKYGFNSTKEHSKKVGGAKDAKGVTGVVYGTNTPKPPRLATRLDNGKTITFFSSPDIKPASLIGKDVAGSKIKTVRYL